MLAGAVGTVRLLLRAPLGSGRGRVVLPQTRCGPPSPRPGLLLCLSAARTMSHLQAPPQPLIRQVTGRPTPTIHPGLTSQNLRYPPHANLPICDTPGHRDSSQGADNFQLGRQQAAAGSKLSTSRSIQTYNSLQKLTKTSLFNCNTTNTTHGF